MISFHLKYCFPMILQRCLLLSTLLHKQCASSICQFTSNQLIYAVHNFFNIHSLKRFITFLVVYILYHSRLLSDISSFTPLKSNHLDRKFHKTEMKEGDEMIILTIPV